MVAEVASESRYDYGELKLRAPLLWYLRQHRWVRQDTIIIEELPWHGRRVDMVTRVRSGILTSYELKLASFGRVLEQAIYNRLSFDRSYLVVEAMPRPENLAEAHRHGVGVILVNDDATYCILRSPLVRAEPVLRQRLGDKVRAAGARCV
jgi:hypothetical protein